MENLNVLHQRNNPYFFLIMVLVCLISCYKVERDCINFHTGEFEFSSIVNGTLKTSYFTRTEKLEIETYEGKIDSASIRWVNDCEMILSPINPKSLNEKKNILIKILTTTDSSYTYEYSYLENSKKLKAEAIRIK